MDDGWTVGDIYRLIATINTGLQIVGLAVCCAGLWLLSQGRKDLLGLLALGLMVCVIQTLVFVLLTMVYIGTSIEEAHHDEHHGEEHAHAAA